MAIGKPNTPKLIASQYKLTREQLDAIITEQVKNELGLHGKKISLTYEIRETGGDPMDRFPGTPNVTALVIHVSDQ